MKKGTKFLSFLAMAVVVGSTWLWGAGCDLAAVDEGADAPLQELVTGVSAATTQADAEQEIQRLLNKTEVGVRWRANVEPGPYDSYLLNKDVIATLAKEQAAFNAGDRQQGATVQEVYDELLAIQAEVETIAEQAVFEFDPPSIDVSVDAVVKSLYVLSRQALADPDKPENALFLAIVTGGAAIPETPEDVPVLSSDQVLSPVQRLLFGVWLHRYGPSLPLYDEDGDAGDKSTGSPNLSCPEGSELCAKFEWKGSQYTFEKPSDKQGIVIISGNANGGTWQSSVPVDRIILKGGTDTDVILANGATSGSFNNWNLVNKGGKKPAISNIQFCTGFRPPTFEECKLICLAKFALCKIFGGTDCEAKLDTCIDACHNQGG